jgi:IS30 family transposase
MDYINHNRSLRTNKHISYEERFYIEKQLQANILKSAIVKALGRFRKTIYTEVRRGTVVQIKQGKLIHM